MNVSDTRSIDERAGEALRSVKAPANVKASTIAAIEARRTTEHASTVASPVASRPKRGRRSLLASLTAAACLAFACMLGVNVLGTSPLPAAYVGIDVNPSIELSVDKDGNVIDTTSLNEDGETVLASLDVTGKPYEAALDTLLTSDAMAGYLSGDALVSVSVVSDDDSLASSIESQSDEVLARIPCQGSCRRSDSATREAARSAGMGTARYETACELMALDASYDLDDCKSMSMRELRDAISSCHEGASSEQQRQQGPHHGIHRTDSARMTS